MRTFGFGAEGRAGKASPLFVLGAFRVVDAAGREGERPEELAREGRGAGAAVAQGVAEVVVLEDEPVADDRGGKGLEEEAEPGIAPLLPTAEREDGAVDDFRRRTRLPPTPLPLTVLGDMPGRIPLGPGSAG